jgi:hypothetical protein
VVVRGDVQAMHNILNSAFKATYPQWSSSVKLSTSTLIFPYTANLKMYYNFLSHGNALSNTPYSIGYSWMDEADVLGLTYANIKNAVTGAIISPNSNSVLYAVVCVHDFLISPSPFLPTSSTTCCETNK